LRIATLVMRMLFCCLVFISIVQSGVWSESGCRIGEGKWSCRRAPLDKGARGVHNGHFHIARGIVVRGGRRQSVCQPALHMSQRSIFPCQRADFFCFWGS